MRRALALALLAACHRSAPPAPTSAWHWVNPLPQGNDLHDVFTPDGKTFLAAGGAGTVLRSSDGGASWTVIATPTDQTLTSLTADRGIYVAVGHAGAIVASTDGGITWLAQKSGTSEDLQAVWSTGRNNLFAVGWHGTILRSTDGGAAWTPLPSPVRGTLFAVSGRRDDLWAAGEAGAILAAAGDGATWKQIDAGTSADLYAIFVTTVGDVVITGDRGAVVRSGDRGATWQATHAPTEEPLFDVWGSGADVIACGLGGALLVSSDGGASFTARPPVAETSLYGIAGTPRGPVVMVGGFGRILVAPTLGGPFRDISTGSRGLLTAVAADDQHVVAVGAGGTLLVDGAARALPEPIPLAAVALEGPVAWLAGGDKLVRLPLDGSAPTITALPGVSLAGLGVVGHNVVAVGADGILFVDGAVDKSGTSTDLAAVTRAGDGWVAVGARGTIVRDGVAVASGVTKDLRGVFPGAHGDLFAAGRGGTLLHSTDGGSTWIKLDVPTRQDLATGAVTGDLVTIAGEAGVILEIRGTAPPRLVPSPTKNALTGIAAGGGKAWIVGAGGTILSR